MISILPYLNKYGSRDFMQVLVGLPYLRDVRRKARSRYFGPFVGYEYFPGTYRPIRKKKNKIQRKRRKKRQKLSTTKGGKKRKQRRKHTT
jgi:hypothetical protein